LTCNRTGQENQTGNHIGLSVARRKTNVTALQCPNITLLSIFTPFGFGHEPNRFTTTETSQDGDLSWKCIKQSTVFAQEPFEHYRSSNHLSLSQRKALNAVATVMPLAAVWSAARTVVSTKTHGSTEEPIAGSAIQIP